MGKHPLAPSLPPHRRGDGAGYVHLVKAIQGGRFQIGNKRGGINGWIGSSSIFGRLVRVEP